MIMSKIRQRSKSSEGFKEQRPFLILQIQEVSISSQDA